VRILYLITRAGCGGAQSHLLKLAEAAARSNDVLVAAGEEGLLCGRLRDLGIACEVLAHLKHAPHAWHDVAGFLELRRLIHRFAPDVVHVHSGKAGLLGRLAAASCRVPAIYTAHGFAFAPAAAWNKRAAALPGEWLGSKTGALTIAVSQSECRLAARHRVGSHHSTVVVHNGCDPAPICAVPEVEPPVVVMVARFARPKRQDLLLRAFQRIESAAQLWCVGDGPELGRVQRMAEAFDLRDRVKFWGDRSDVAELLAQAQIAALISDHEGFGLSLIEAMSASLPAIASDVGGMREIVVHERTGLLVPNDEESLAAALRRLIDDPHERSRMGSAGRARYRERFTTERMLRETFRTYEMVLGIGQAKRCQHCVYPAACTTNLAVSGD